ncbi:uncharacterized protein BDV14DRAFT_202439 [Aspergillus stella-maris]|uniref:uncharacterized protein n=1 Tax=Aspergillus stella-maris TaxID=1810926 RepID=UPI003CCCDEC9
MSEVSSLTRLAIQIERTQVPWGCAIYRTTYSSFSDTHFDQVVELITVMVEDNVHRWEGLHTNNDDETRGAKAVLLENYRPIVMNNKSQFDGMSMKDIRAYHGSFIGTPVGERPYTSDFFCILIDEEVMHVLAGANQISLLATEDRVDDGREYWVKTIDTDLEDEEDEYGRGWMKCSIYSLWSLCLAMDGHLPMKSFAALYPDGPYEG